MSFIPSADVKSKDKKNANTNNTSSAALQLPTTQSSDYCAELDDRKMDFSSLEDKIFIVAVNTGDRNKPKLLASTIRGPFDFFEMVESVGSMYEREQHHGKVYILEKSFDKPTSFLDEGTIDYIEANWQDIIATGILEAAIAQDPADIIQAGTIGIKYDKESET